MIFDFIMIVSCFSSILKLVSEMVKFSFIVNMIGTKSLILFCYCEFFIESLTKDLVGEMKCFVRGDVEKLYENFDRIQKAFDPHCIF